MNGRQYVDDVIEVRLRCGQILLLNSLDALRYVGVGIGVSSHGYARIDAKRWTGDRYLHRDVLLAPPGSVVDHINGNKLDNTRANLRICTQAENCLNSKTRTNSKSGITGVYWDKVRLKWCAQISTKNVMKALGRYDSLEEAVAARTAAELEYHGQFAAINGVLRGRNVSI